MLGRAGALREDSALDGMELDLDRGGDALDVSEVERVEGRMSA
jgi:hypothetical protein